jgi:glycosyltransferase involved in cell wall biosynthesis
LCDGVVLQEVVLVDDGSSDGTPSLLAALASNPAWKIVSSHPGHHGKGDAVARGAMVAGSTLLLLSDVDLAVSLDQVANLATALSDGADLAIGSRDIVGSKIMAPKYRIFIGRAFNRLVRATTGLDVRDTQCGFKLLRTDLARSLLSSLLIPGLAFDVEFLMRARVGGHRIAEVPVTYRHGETSKVRPVMDAVIMARDVARLVIHFQLRPALSGRFAGAGTTQ